MGKENLEFYKRAYHLREHCKSHNRRSYCGIIDQLVVIYFQNGHTFPDTLEISNFTYKRISIMKSLLTDLGFFGENRSISSYNLTKKPMKMRGICGWYNEYTLIVSPK